MKFSIGIIHRFLKKVKELTELKNRFDFEYSDNIAAVLEKIKGNNNE